MGGINEQINLIPLNTIFKSNLEYIESLRNKIKVVLGTDWGIYQNTCTYREGTQISLILVTPEKIQISSKIQLMKYCELRQIRKDKIGFLRFDVWQTNSKKSHNCYSLEINQTPMRRALEGLRAKKWLLNQLQ